MTNLTLSESLEGTEVVIEVAGVRIPRLSPYYGATRSGEVGAIVGSTGRIEIFLNGGSARERLGVGRGAPVRMWKSRRVNSASPRQR